MSALTILRAASRDVANERYVEVMEAIDALDELVATSGVLLGEWDRQDGGKFDPMPARDWFAAEAQFRAALARCNGGEA